MFFNDVIKYADADLKYVKSKSLNLQECTVIHDQKYPSLPKEWMITPKKRPCNNSNQDVQHENDKSFFDFNEFSLRKFICVEMLGIGDPGHLEPRSEQHIDNFFRVPIFLEKFLLLGFLAALDSFLYVVTYLPIRFCFSSVLLVKGIVESSVGKRKFDVHRTHIYDFMRGCIALVGCYALSLVNMSRVYHYIRMQNIIKLYVLTAMMEVFDNLLTSFGIDVFDSLLWKINSPVIKKSTILSFIITVVYVTVHSSLYFLHIATLTVAINTGDQSLLTVLVLNNFAEMKSFVLRKFDRDNLFQLSCSDISERLKMVLFYFLIVVVGLSQSSNVWDVIPNYFTVTLAMLTSEVGVDWIKHAFIAKFNGIDASCYEEFGRILRRDFLNCHKDKIKYDHSYNITRRLGISQIPLGCVFVRYLTLALTSSKMLAYASTWSTISLAVGCSLLFCVCVVIKTVLSVSLIYYASYCVCRDRIEEEKLDSITAKPSSSTRDKDVASHVHLKNVERYTMLKGRIIG
jgi:hypothetical protein